jgi:hypothetical protein
MLWGKRDIINNSSEGEQRRRMKFGSFDPVREWFLAVSVEEGDRLDGRNFEALTATHVLAHHHVIFAEHVGTGFCEAGAVAVVGTRRKIPFFGADKPVNFIFRTLVAMRTV